MSLEDEEGSKKSISSQTIAVETRASLVMELNLPKDSDSKSYTLSIEVRDINDNSLISKASQKIILFKGFYIKINYKGLFYLISAILIVTIILLIIIWTTHRHHKKLLEKKLKYHHPVGISSKRVLGR